MVKIKRYMLPLAMAVCANSAISQDYGWYYSPHAIVGPFNSPAELCATFGASVESMTPIGLVSWGDIGSSGQCGEPTGGLNFWRLGDSCPAGKVYDAKNMSCELPEPEPKNEQCENGLKDIDGQCSPQSAPPDSDDKNSCDNMDENGGGGVDWGGNPILISTGQKAEIVNDISIPDSSLKFSRNYWSSRLDTSSVGLAWQHNWQMSIKELQSRDRIKLYRNNGRGIIFMPRNGRWESDSKDTEVITKLANNQGWKVQTATGEVELYNHLGQLVSYEKQGYPKITLSYNANKQLSQLKDTKGRSLVLTYNTKGLISKVTTSNGSAINYSYDSKNRLVSFTKDGNTQKYHYENAKRLQLLTGITDARGVRYATWAYNDKGLAISSEHASGTDKYTFEYLPNNQTRITNPLGKTSLYTFQDIRLEKKIKSIKGEPLNTCIGTNRSFIYNAKGLALSEQRANGSEITYQYNDRGLEIRRNVDKSTGYNYKTVTTKWHDTLPLPIEINKRGQQQTFKYDDNGRLVEYTNGFKDLSELNQGKDIALLQFNDFTDEVGNAWQKVGNPQIVDDPEAVTGKALYLDENAYLQLSDKKLFDFGTGDFTIEMWVKPEEKEHPYSGHLLTGMYRSGIGGSFETYINKSGVYWNAYQNGETNQSNLNASVNLLDGVWHHIAFSRKDNVIRLFIDGKLRANRDDKNNYLLGDKVIVGIGSSIAEKDYFGGVNKNYKGYLDQIRVSKRAIYTENFTPSQTPYTLNQGIKTK